MPHANSTLARRLRYRLPRLKLCLVREGRLNKEPILIRDPFDAQEFLEPLRSAPEEHFISLHLNVRHEVIGIHEVSHGTVSSSLVHPREVFKAALLANSYALILCHNHPSGSAIYASREDIEATRQLLRVGHLLGISILDHLIVGPQQGFLSMREKYAELWEEKRGRTH